MALTSPRPATLNKLYQGAIAARACSSVRLDMAVSWMLTGVGEVWARTDMGRVDNAAAIISMYVILHTMKVDILICNCYFRVWQKLLIPKGKHWPPPPGCFASRAITAPRCTTF